MRRSSIPSGLCANCAATVFIQGVSPLDAIVAAKGPDVLLLAPVQEQFARLMAAGHADADPVEIDWPTVVRNWDLPFKVERVMG